MAEQELWSYTALIDNSDKAAADANLAATSGDFVNLLSDDLLHEFDANDLEPSPGAGTGIFQVNRSQRRNIKTALIDLPTVFFEEQARRMPSRYPDPWDVFIARKQYRRRPSFDEETQEWSHTFVHALGLFKTGVLSSPQPIGSDWSLIDQWDIEQDMINTVRSGDGNRIEVNFAGTYELDTKGMFDEEQGLEFQWIKNTGTVGPIYQFPDPGGSARPEVWVEELAVNDKIGIGIRSTAGDAFFNLLQGSWMGLNRIY